MIQFLPQNEFFRKLEYERSLTDRNDRVFSIIIFDLTTTNDNFSVMSNFVYALKKRFRQTDEIGWLNEHHLCAILPETPAEKAKRPANDVCALIPPNQIAPSWSIFTYPSNWINVEKTIRCDLHRRTMTL